MTHLIIDHRASGCFGTSLTPPRFLHAAKGINVVLEQLEGPLWARPLVGCYRLQ